MQTEARRKAAQKRKAEAAARRAAADKETHSLQDTWSQRLCEGKVPVKRWEEFQIEQALEQLRACDAVSADALPSCCMLTFPQVCLVKKLHWWERGIWLTGCHMLIQMLGKHWQHLGLSTESCCSCE